jgi:hypothetical protein
MQFLGKSKCLAWFELRGLRRYVSLPVSELEALKKLLQTAIQNRR